MFRDPHPTAIIQRPLARQRGVGLPAAIFVITLMVTISIAVSYLVSQNARTFEEEISLTRAFYAAESGAGFAMNALYPPDEFPLYNVTASCPAAARTYTFSANGLAGCSAEMTCTTDATVDGVKYYTIQSAGICGDVRRTVQVRSSF